MKNDDYCFVFLEKELNEEIKQYKPPRSIPMLVDVMPSTSLSGEIDSVTASLST